MAIKTIFERKVLCAGSMCDYLVIQERKQKPTGLGQPQAGFDFMQINAYDGKIESTKGTKRFDGVTIDPKITHLAYMPFDQEIYELDTNSLFVELERTRNRRYKLDSIRDYGEQEEWLLLYLIDNGFADLEATGA